MLAEIYPRDHARFTSLPLLGPHLEGFVVWLRSQGYPRLPIRLRIRETPRLAARLRRRRVRRLGVISRAQLLEFAPRVVLDDVYLSALVRSLASYLDEHGLLARPAATAHEQLVAAYRAYLDRVRGLADPTAMQHCSTASELLTFLGFDRDHTVFQHVGPRQIEAFVRTAATRLCRASLQHTVARVRSFLRFLANRNEITRGLDSSIATPRLYRGEQLPRALPWETVQAFLAAIDRSTSKGRRDYAMFVVIATYGLRTSEVAALRLDDIEWRPGRLRVTRSKTRTSAILPLSDEAGSAVLDYPVRPVITIADLRAHDAPSWVLTMGGIRAQKRPSEALASPTRSGTSATRGRGERHLAPSGASGIGGEQVAQIVQAPPPRTPSGLRVSQLQRAARVRLSVHERARRCEQRMPRRRSDVTQAASRKVSSGGVRRCQMSKLIRSFRVAFGFTPHRYLTQLRLGQARQLLRYGHDSGEVAHAVGFYDQSQMNRHFIRYYGITPGRYARSIV